METLQKHFLHFGDGKDFPKVVYPTLNGIAVRDQYLFFTPVDLQARWSNQVQHTQTNKTISNKENRRLGSFFRSKHKHDNPVVSLDCARVN